MKIVRRLLSDLFHANCFIDMKTCKTCQETKPLLDFYKQTKRGIDGVRGSCKICCNIVKNAYRLKNRDKILANKKQDYQDNKERYLVVKKEYRQANKGKINALVAARKKVVKRRTPAWLTDFDKLKIKCMYSIAAMLTRENKEPWHIDHIIPLQGKMVSGLHVPSNLQVMLGSENIGKKNKFEVNHA